MKVSFLDFKREWNKFEKSFLIAFKKFGQSGIYVLGPEVEKFESNFANFCGYKYAIGVSTGLSAIEIILRAYGIKEGDEVITVPNTAVATSLAISSVGAKPVFCDIGDDFLINAKEIEKLITRNTKAILPVHLFGKVCDMKAINKIANDHNLVVVEDACQAHGANYIGQSLINSKAFSFYPTKNLGAFGEAGAIVTNDKKVRDFAVSYRNYGQEGRYNHVLKGINGRIDPLQCVLMSVKLKHLKQFINKRRAIVEKYCKELKNISNLVVLNFDKGSSCHLFVIRVLNGQRDELKAYLRDKGIEAMIHYPVSINKQPCYENEYSNTVLNKNELLQSQILSLPCYPFLKNAEQNYVIKEIKNFFRNKNR